MIIHRPRWIFKSRAPATKDRIYFSLVSRSRNFSRNSSPELTASRFARTHRLPKYISLKNTSSISTCISRLSRFREANSI